MTKVTAHDVAQLLASPPPRQVPAQVAKAVASGLSAWIIPLVGTALFCFGMVFVAVFFPWRFADEWRLDSDSARVARGTITAVKPTNMSINKTRVMEYEYSFTAEDGRNRQDRCFTTGSRWAVNAQVTVRYLSAKPEVARPEGARLSEGGFAGVLVIIFPLIGVGLVVGSAVLRLRQRRLLHEGLVAEVNVVSATQTNTRVNNRYAYKIVLSSPSWLNGQQVTVRRSNPADVALALKHLQSKQPVYILHDIKTPQRLIFPAALITV